ncbi:uncharacterized protein TNCV_1694541 [Trichonephila clavipes]|nr:uncharacterized protein TNCV_1694541 [Trichonephila clavipes]
MEAFNTGSPFTNTIVITAEVESGFVTKDDLVSLRSTTLNGDVDGWASRAAQVVKGAVIPNVLRPGAFVWFEKTQAPLLTVLPVFG